MEGVRIVLDNAEEYDKAVRGGAPECGDVRIISKSDCTGRGNPGVCISFTSVVDGKHVPVQAVITGKCFIAAARTILARHRELGNL